MNWRATDSRNWLDGLVPGTAVCPVFATCLGLHLLVILSTVLTVTVAGCTELPVTTIPAPITPTPVVPSPMISPNPTLVGQDTFTPSLPSAAATSTVVSKPVDPLIYDKLDPFFREDLERVANYEQLILDLCFEQPPGEEVLRAIETQVVDIQSAGPLAGPIEVPCWAVRVSISPRSLPEISPIDSLYKMVLIEPAPAGSYLPKLGGVVQFLAKYRGNSANLAVFVHVERELSQARIGELEELGLTLVPETWIPSLGSHPTGFYLGKIQVFDIVRLAKLGDIVRIESAEEEMGPSSEGGAVPGGGTE